MSEAAEDRMMALGYDPLYGARPMKRLLQSKIETLVAKSLIEGSVMPGHTIIVDVNESGDFSISID